MAIYRTIRCTDCGSEHRTRRANTLYCSFHRFLRDFKYVRGQTLHAKKCLLCSAPYMPVSVKQNYCGQHMMLPPSYPEAECAMCHQTAQQIHPDVRVCAICATYPANNVKFHELLHQKDGWLKQHPITLEDHDASE